MHQVVGLGQIEFWDATGLSLCVFNGLLTDVPSSQSPNRTMAGLHSLDGHPLIMTFIQSGKLGVVLSGLDPRHQSIQSFPSLYGVISSSSNPDIIFASSEVVLETLVSMVPSNILRHLHNLEHVHLDDQQLK
uniref:Uncharacterized protein n=1 Tax=Cacopsylla melanoneura TaxID=428564 RepID=A0A8D8Z871_9HEMI